MRDRSSDPITLALKLLSKEVQNRIKKHPSAHILGNRRDQIELRVRIPTGRQRGWPASERSSVAKSLTNSIRKLFVRHAVCRPGRVFCLRCAAADCSHSAPSRPTEVFAGYSPSGVPRFLDLGQWLLDRRDPRVDLLYRKPPVLLAHRTEGIELTKSLLPVFRDRDSGYHIHGQVTAGWYEFPSLLGSRESLALTFQLISTQSPRGGRRLGLNLIGVGPDDQPLENLYDLTGEIPWFEAARWADRAVAQIDRLLARRPKQGQLQSVEHRIQGVLSGLANRLERERRSRGRKTAHGQKRHGQKNRPTWKALDDLQHAKDDQVMIDTRRDTFVVLGSNGRAHVFNRSARLVTSIRYSPDAIERRCRQGIWKPAIPSEVEELRSASGRSRS